MPENIRVVAENCDGCEKCLAACPFLAIEMAESVAVIAESCVECGLCVPACPPGAIQMSGAEDVSSSTGRWMWVYVPSEHASLAGVAACRRAADEMEAKVAAVLTAEPADSSRIFAAGADEVIVLTGPAPPGELLAWAVDHEKPGLLSGLADVRSLAVLSAAAARVGAGLVQAASDLVTGYGESSWEALRPIYGGRFSQRLSPQPGRPGVVALDPWVFHRARQEGGRSGRVREIGVSNIVGTALDNAAGNTLDNAVGHAAGNANPGDRYERLGSREESRPVSLAKSRIVVAGGLGLRSPGNFAKLYALAERLGAVVGATKDVVEQGWAAPTQMIDLVGSSIAPHLYLAFGIDGTPTHNAAVEKSKAIVAVTSNREANILGIADLIVPFDPVEALEAFLASGFGR